jgi:hypothetical protein
MTEQYVASDDRSPLIYLARPDWARQQPRRARLGRCSGPSLRRRDRFLRRWLGSAA